MIYNNELQTIDNQNKAYLLGLFYADGNISKNQHHTKLYLKDKELIDKLKLEYPFFNYYSRENSLFGIQSGKKEVRNHFILNGCLPDKSVSNKENLKLPFRNEFTNHFIRGYFDGDGGCTLTNSGNKVQKRVYLYSASYDFLIEIKDYLYCFKIKCSITKTNSIYKLTILSDSYIKFYDFIYRDSIIYMNRKKELFSKLLDTKFFIQKEAPECKFCNSRNTVYNGNYTYKGVIKPRILCKDCNNNFIIQSAPCSSNITSGEDELLEA